jgi:hypothetical protein
MKIHKAVLKGYVSRIKNWDDFERVGKMVIRSASKGKLNNKDLDELGNMLTKVELTLKRRTK